MSSNPGCYRRASSLCDSSCHGPIPASYSSLPSTCSYSPLPDNYQSSCQNIQITRHDISASYGHLRSRYLGSLPRVAPLRLSPYCGAPFFLPSTVIGTHLPSHAKSRLAHALHSPASSKNIPDPLVFPHTAEDFFLWNLRSIFRFIVTSTFSFGSDIKYGPLHTSKKEPHSLLSFVPLDDDIRVF